MPYKFKLMGGGEQKLDENGELCKCEGCGAVLQANPDERASNWKKRCNCNISCAIKARHRKWREGVPGVRRPGPARWERPPIEDWMFKPYSLPAHINEQMFSRRMYRGSIFTKAA